MEYTKENLLRVAKRQNNAKRSYLLVNPLQAKHIPASPGATWEMAETLGKRLAERHGTARLLIAFAETATAIGAIAARTISPECVFLTTTRENFAGEFVEFSEEHSHAVEQKLFADGLPERIRATEKIILLDDEFSTGKTLRNMVGKLREIFPECRQKEIVAASLLNRLSPENDERLRAAKIQTEFLLKLPDELDAEKIAGVETREALPPPPGELPRKTILPGTLPNPRKGVAVGRYESACREVNAEIFRELPSAPKEILLLGTEECMFPAVFLGRELERKFPAAKVFCHATTRSPIGISDAPGYPMRNGFRLPSFYDKDRATYIYLLRRYDLVLILTDANDPDVSAATALNSALSSCGCKDIRLLEVRTE